MQTDSTLEAEFQGIYHVGSVDTAGYSSQRIETFSAAFFIATTHIEVFGRPKLNDGCHAVQKHPSDKSPAISSNLRKLALPGFIQAY